MGVWPFFAPKYDPHVPPGKPIPAPGRTRKHEPKKTIPAKKKGPKS